MAELLTEDYIYEKDMEYNDRFEERLWLTVPGSVARKYVKIPENAEKLNKLLSEKRYANPVFKKGDSGLLRWLRMVKNHLKQHSNYKKYYR